MQKACNSCRSRQEFFFFSLWQCFLPCTLLVILFFEQDPYSNKYLVFACKNRLRYSRERAVQSLLIPTTPAACCAGRDGESRGGESRCGSGGAASGGSSAARNDGLGARCGGAAFLFAALFAAGRGPPGDRADSGLRRRMNHSIVKIIHQ